MRIFFFSLILFLCSQAEAQKFKKIYSLTHPSSLSVMKCLHQKNYVVAGDSLGRIFSIDTKNYSVNYLSQKHLAPVNDIEFNSLDSLMITTSANGQILIHEIKSGRLLHSLSGTEYEGIKFALFSIADGFIYFNAYGRLYKVRSDFNAEVKKLYDFQFPIQCGAITPDRSFLIISNGNQLKVISTRTDNVIQEIETGAGEISEMEITQDKKLITWNTDGTIRKYSLGLNGIQYPPEDAFKAGYSCPLAFNQTGQLLITGRVGNWMRLWDFNQHSVKQELFGHNDAVMTYAFCNNDNMIISSSIDKKIFFWSTEEEIIPEPLAEVIIPPPPPVETKIQPSIPLSINGRSIQLSQMVEVSDSLIDLYIYDDMNVDGDTVTLYYNGKIILDNFGVNKSKEKVTIEVEKGFDNELVLYAVNMGISPPNTAAIEFTESGLFKMIRLNADLKRCSKIVFRRK